MGLFHRANHTSSQYGPMVVRRNNDRNANTIQRGLESVGNGDLGHDLTYSDQVGEGSWLNQKNPYIRGRQAGLSTGESAMVVGTSGYTFNKSFEKARAKQRAAEMARDEDARQAAIDEQLAMVDANYGVGDNAAAEGSRATLGGILDKTTSDYQAGENENLQGMFSQALSQNRFALADRGLTGSGVDADATKGAVGTYLGGRQKVAQNAGMFRSSLESGINAQRNTLRDQVMRGTSLNPDTLSQINDASYTVGRAQANIPAQTIGNIFGQGGAALGQGEVTNANRNNASLWGSTSSQPATGPQVITRPSASGSSAGHYS